MSEIFLDIDYTTISKSQLFPGTLQIGAICFSFTSNYVSFENTYVS